MAARRKPKRDGFRMTVDGISVPPGAWDKAGSHKKAVELLLATGKVGVGQQIRVASTYSGLVKEYHMTDDGTRIVRNAEG